MMLYDTLLTSLKMIPVARLEREKRERERERGGGERESKIHITCI